MISYASFLEKKDVKKTSPLMVVNERELSIKSEFTLFSTFFISSLGILMKVPPKNKLEELKLE